MSAMREYNERDWLSHALLQVRPCALQWQGRKALVGTVLYEDDVLYIGLDFSLQLRKQLYLRSTNISLFIPRKRT